MVTDVFQDYGEYTSVSVIQQRKHVCSTDSGLLSQVLPEYSTAVR